jgi:hypothetical protein
MAAFAVATLFVGGAMAQTHNGTAVPGGAANYAASTAQGTTYITEGTTVPMYVLPDPYFHPNYNVATSVWTLTDGFTWTFSGTATTALTVTQTAVNIAGDNNYVTIAAGAGDAAGSPYTLTVTENAPAAYGGCSGPAVNLTVNVVTAPSFAINGGDATYAFCEGNPGFPANINTTIAGGWQNYRLAWNLAITTLDNASAVEFYYTDETGAGQNAALTYAVNHTIDETTNPFEALAAASAAHDIMTVPNFLVINNGTRDAVTVYTYTLVSVNDQASRFGDFITLGGATADASAFTYYAATAASDQVVVTVYPAPVTGPIYHITNTWAN